VFIFFALLLLFPPLLRIFLLLFANVFYGVLKTTLLNKLLAVLFLHKRKKVFIINFQKIIPANRVLKKIPINISIKKFNRTGAG